MAAVYASRGQSGLVYTSHEGHGRTCPHRPGFRLGDSRRQGYRVRVRGTRPWIWVSTKITVEQLKGGVPDVNANAFKDSPGWQRTFRPAPPHCSTPPPPSWPTAIWSATAHWPSVSPKPTSWPRKPSIPARPKPCSTKWDRNRQVQGAVGLLEYALPFLHYQLFRVAGVHRLQFVTLSWLGRNYGRATPWGYIGSLSLTPRLQTAHWAVCLTARPQRGEPRTTQPTRTTPSRRRRNSHPDHRGGLCG